MKYNPNKEEYQHKTTPVPRIAAVDLDDIADIKLASHIKLHNGKADLLQKLDKTNPWELILEENPKVVYRGTVTFTFKNKYLNAMLKRYGNPDSEIEQNTQSITEYTVSDAIITTKDLFWLTSLPDNGVRLKGPTELLQSVREYYAKAANTLTDAKIRYSPYNKV